jgi:tetratricopeptide (TPR) repeat protein
MLRPRTVLMWLPAVILVGTPAFAGQAPTPAAAQPPAVNPGQAYYEFLLARRLEAQGDDQGALAALERAQKLDPSSADVLAEKAGYYARQNKAIEAKRAADQALALDPKNGEAHRVLGLVFSAWSEGAAPPPDGETPATLREKAIEHLAAIQDSPEMATDLSLQVSLGRLQLRAGRVPQAAALLEKIVSQAPYAAEPYALLAEARIAEGNFEAASEALSSAAEINPRYYVMLADLYEKQGKFAEAAGALNGAVQNMRAPSRDLKLRLAATLLNVPGGIGAGRAREVLTDLLKTNPDDARALYLKSTAERRMGDTRAAEETARKLLAIDPTGLNGLSALAESLVERYAYQQVIDALTPFEKDAAMRAKGREAEGAAVLMQLGIARLQLAQWDQAIAAFAGAKALTPTNDQLDAFIAQAHFSARRFDKADAVAKAALASRPGSAPLLRLRALAIARAGRPAEAVTLMEGAAAAAPRSRGLALGLADVYMAAGRPADAIRVVEQAQTAFADDDEIALRLGGVYEEAGRVADAEREFRRLISADPLDATALNYLGYMLADKGPATRLAEAVELIQRALKIEPDNPAYLDSLGWALLKQGRLDEAEPALAKAAAALPANSVIQDHLGDALARRSRWTEAAAAWDRALAGDNDSLDRAAVEKKLKDAKSRRR